MAEKVGGLYYEIELDTAKLIAGSRQVNTEVDKAALAFNRITTAVKTLAAVMAVLKIAERADEFRLLSARVDVAAGSIESGAAAFAQLVAISRQTQTSLAGNIEVFARLNQSILQMGGTQADTLRLTDLLAKAIKVSGANATEAKSAMVQFGQALGSGKLAGDELRSLLEAAPYLMRQLADGLGVPIGALKKLGEEGKLTSDVVVNALGGAAEKIEADFKTFPQTFAGAMQVLQDSAGLAALKFDELSGSSATMTGLALGAAEAFDKLGEGIAATNDKAGELGRNKAVRTWADESRIAFSYLIDVADVVWQTLSVLGRNVAFVFKGVVTEVQGIGSQIAAVARGDFEGAKAIGEAMTAEAESRRKELDDADAKTLARTKLFGQQMREAWDQGAGGGRGFVNPQAAGSKLKDTGGGKDKAKGGAKFDADGYLSGLSQQTVEAYARIEATEREALQRNATLLASKKITYEQSAQAILLIEQKATNDRQDLQRAGGEERRKLIEQQAKEEETQRKKLADEQKRGRDFADDLLVEGDPVATLQLELEKKLEMIRYYQGVEGMDLERLSQAKIAIERSTAAQIKEIRDRQTADQAANNAYSLGLMSDLAGQVFGLLQKSGKDQTALSKAAFLAQKAIAVAEIIMNTEVAAAKAGAQLGIYGIPMATMIRAAGYASAGMVTGMAIGEVTGGRQYGGPTSAGSMYRVNETGRPEMFTAANGNQYMLGSTDGQVTPAGEMGGAVALQVQVINNHPTAQVTASTDKEGRTAQIVIAQLVDQVDNNNGPFFSALRRSTNVQGRL